MFSALPREAELAADIPRSRIRATFGHPPQCRATVTRPQLGFRVSDARSSGVSISLYVDATDDAPLCDAVDDEVDCVLTGHVLLAEKLCGRALCLGEYRYKKLCAGPCRTTPPLCIERRALLHALKASGPLGL